MTTNVHVHGLDKILRDAAGLTATQRLTEVAIETFRNKDLNMHIPIVSLKQLNQLIP
jgi:hypothetical protein